MRAKKSLGQNFLTNKNIARDMARAGNVRGGGTVIEIGPGKGILTEALLEAGAKVVAIEKDGALLSFLREKFAGEIKSKKLIVTHGDALKFVPASDQLQVTSYKIVANIPYYITGALLRHIFSQMILPSCMILMLQKEVAERIAARDGKESTLSLSVKAYGEPRIIRTVRASNFSPAPKVDSAILCIANISRKNFKAKGSERKFFALVKAGFAQKRKLLASNLIRSGLLLNAPSAMATCGIPPRARAEEVSAEQFIHMAALAEKEG